MNCTRIGWVTISVGDSVTKGYARDSTLQEILLQAVQSYFCCITWAGIARSSDQPVPEPLAVQWTITVAQNCHGW